MQWALMTILIPIKENILRNKEILMPSEAMATNKGLKIISKKA